MRNRDAEIDDLVVVGSLTIVVVQILLVLLLPERWWHGVAYEPVRDFLTEDFLELGPIQHILTSMRPAVASALFTIGNALRGAAIEFGHKPPMGGRHKHCSSALSLPLVRHALKS
jgi:hypothetical protein